MVKSGLPVRNICYCSCKEYCRFCNGSGMTECLSCKYDSIHDNKGKKLSKPFDITIRSKRSKKCEKCSKGWIECPFCGGSGQSHQFF